MYKIKSLFFFPLLIFIGCNEPEDKWSKIFLDEVPKLPFKLRNCKDTNKYLDKPIETTYKSEKVKIIGISVKYCETDRKSIVGYSKNYVLLKNQKTEHLKGYYDKVRIITPAYMSLYTGNDKYLDNYLKEYKK